MTDRNRSISPIRTKLSSSSRASVKLAGPLDRSKTNPVGSSVPLEAVRNGKSNGSSNGFVDHTKRSVSSNGSRKVLIPRTLEIKPGPISGPIVNGHTGGPIPEQALAEIKSETTIPISHYPEFKVLPPPSPQPTISSPTEISSIRIPSRRKEPGEAGSIDRLRQNETEIEASSIEEELFGLGFVVTDKIITRNSDGILEAQYLKVVTEDGNKAFVKLDVDGSVKIPKNNSRIYQPVAVPDLGTSGADRGLDRLRSESPAKGLKGQRATVSEVVAPLLPPPPPILPPVQDPVPIAPIESFTADLIPYSVKMGTLECAGLTVCGVAFECDDQICTLTRSEKDLEPREIIFTTTLEPGNRRNGYIQNHPIGYPIVKMSEIRANPSRVRTYIDEAMRNIRDSAYRSCAVIGQDYLNTQKDNLVSAHRQLVGQIIRTFGSLLRDLRELEHRRNEEKPDYESGNLTSEGEMQYKLIPFNIRRRNEMLEELMKVCNYVNYEFGSRMEQLTNEMQTLSEQISQSYDGIEGRLLFSS